MIKRTKVSEKNNQQLVSMGAISPPGLTNSVPTSDTYSDSMAHTRAASVDSRYDAEYDFGQPLDHPHYDPYGSQVQTPLYNPHSGLPTPGYVFTPYEVDIKTERQMYVNDVPTRRDSSISTFSTFQPPPPHAMLPSYTGEDWVQEDFFESQQDSLVADEGLDFNFFDFQHGSPHLTQSTTIEVDESDRHLLDHFLDNVLRLIFPILETNQHGSARSEVILPALESNKGYLHCCLCISAIHLKATRRVQGEQIDQDIMRHRYATISELCGALDRDESHVQILEATLGMIFFQCSVGRPDDCLPDIAWHQHFQAASSLVHKLDMPRLMVESDSTNPHPPFNMTLASWIDILGSTMLGRSPQFANAYRTKHISGSTSGLCELMGCEDRIMYLISEIACLDSLNLEGRMDTMQLCSHITALAQQLDYTEGPPDYVASPWSTTGALRPRQLSRNMTAIFRIAARVYLCSLIHSFDRYQPSTLILVNRLAELLQFIPSGPEGFDRSLVWPILICGSVSTPGCSFRSVFAERISLLGEQAEYGSFGRMVRLLHEVWRLADSPSTPPTPHSQIESDGTITPQQQQQLQQPQQARQNVHWRDVMQQKGWDFLLI